MSTNEHPHTSAEEARHERLCAYVFGELDETQRRAIEAELESDPALAEEHARLLSTVGLVQEALPREELSPAIRATLSAAAQAEVRRSRFRFLRGGAVRAAAAAVILLVVALQVLSPWEDSSVGFEQVARQESASNEALESRARGPAPAALEPEALESLRALGYTGDAEEDAVASRASKRRAPSPTVARDRVASLDALGYAGADSQPVATKDAPQSAPAPAEPELTMEALGDLAALGYVDSRESDAGRRLDADESKAREESERRWGTPGSVGRQRELARNEPLAKEEQASGQGGGGVSGLAGARDDSGQDAFFLGRGEPPVEEEATGTGGGSGGKFAGRFRRRAMSRQVVAPEPAPPATLGDEDALVVTLGESRQDLLGQIELQRTVTGPRVERAPDALQQWAGRLLATCRLQEGESPAGQFFRWWGDHPFVPTVEDTLSTFAVDVDTASYSLARRTLRRGRLPAREQVRTEEFVNSFAPDPVSAVRNDEAPLQIGLELAPSRFHADPRVEMLRITLRADDLAEYERQPLTLTVVIDVSGSMSHDRLALVTRSVRLLLDRLGPSDTVAIVVYSASARVVQPMVSAANRTAFEGVLDRLTAGGGTNIEAGLRLGYDVATNALTPGSVNRVLLFSDGVGNVGETNVQALLRLVEQDRASEIYLNTLGVGIGDHGDAFLEQLADRGDGLCHYLGDFDDAKRALGEGFVSLMQPVARDVKIQVELDPTQVRRFRQLGYENRALAHSEFRKDSVDAGEVNAGHQVTALFEIERMAGTSGVTVRVRYKPPFALDSGRADRVSTQAAEVAHEIERTLTEGDRAGSFSGASFGYRRAVLAAQLAEVLRGSVHARGDSLEDLEREARLLSEERDDYGAADLLDLVARARPMLEAREESPALLELLDELSRLHYEHGLAEQLAREDGLSEEEVEAFERRRAELEGLVRQQVLADGGAPATQLSPEQLEELEALGYSGDR